MPRRIQFVIAIFVTLSVVGNVTAQEGGAVATKAVAELQALRERHDKAWARLERLKQDNHQSRQKPSDHSDWGWYPKKTQSLVFPFTQESALSAKVLILPGIGNSGPLHWQSIWEQSHPEFVRFQQHDWDNPVCEEWVAVTEEA
jgi:Serine hydrolase